MDFEVNPITGQLDLTGTDYQEFIATAGQTEFVVTDFAIYAKSIVSVDGAIQDTGIYTIDVANNKVVFASGLSVNQNVKVLR